MRYRAKKWCANDATLSLSEGGRFSHLSLCDFSMYDVFETSVFSFNSLCLYDVFEISVFSFNSLCLVTSVLVDVISSNFWRRICRSKHNYENDSQVVSARFQQPDVQ